MTVFAITAAILDRVLQERSVFSIGRADCEAIAEYVETYNEERRRLGRQNGDREKHLTRRAGEIARELARASGRRHRQASAISIRSARA